MLDVAVIEEPAAAAVTLDPKRARLLAEMAEPVSAAALATRVGLPRQKVNYHLRTLEKHGLGAHRGRAQVGRADRTAAGGDRPFVRGESRRRWARWPATRNAHADRLSASYLIALAARIVREVSHFLRRSAETGKRLATLSIDTEIRFASPEARARFSSELLAAAGDLARRYHDESAPGGRRHRLVVVAYPAPAGAPAKETP